MKNLPIEYENRMKKLLGKEFEDYKKALEQSPVRALRVNTDKISVGEFVKVCPFTIEKIPYVENGFYFDDEKIGNHPFHHAGMFYVQEPGAMAPAECVEIKPDFKILDMCAAPGGKSTQLKNKLSENGVLVSNEIIPSRCKILTGNIERLGLKNVVTTCLDTKKLVSLYPNTFDVIMVDAPCSGEGMFRKEEIAIDEWSEENVQMCAKRQREILENAAICLKSGGHIVYATCTFSLEENEMTIDTFLNEHSEFEVVPVTKAVAEATEDGILFDGCKCKALNLCRRFYPHKAKGEGQFMAVLHKKGESLQIKHKSNGKPDKIDKTVFDFLDETLKNYDKEKVMLYNGNPVYFTPDFEVKKGTAFSCGVTIGEICKNYIKPHHQFFMAMGDSFKNKIELAPESDEIKKYLHGEEFLTDAENGWAVVSICGCSVGGVKVSSGRAKNHYPKGLRSK